MKNLLYTFAFSVLLSSCDYVNPDAVYKQKAAPSTKKVLLEVFTGWRCVNCPEGTAEGLGAIKSAGYEKNTVIMKIHAEFFATPGGEFTDDFRSATGNILNLNFGITSNPQGVVGRKKFAGSYSQSTGAWVEKIAEIITKDTVYAPLELELTVDYSEVSRKVSLKATALLSRNINKKINILAYITEDSIVQPQLVPKSEDAPEGINEKFVHRYVLRGQLQGRNGDLLLEQGNINQSIRKTFDIYTISDKWRDKQCSLVVIATNVAGEVLQVEEIKIIE